MDIICITKKMLFDMIKQQKTLPKFTPEGAVASLLYDRLRGKDLSQREYGKIWNWSRGSVRHKWAEIDAICTALELKSQQPNVSPKNSLIDTKNDELQPSVSPHLYNNYYSNIKPLNNLIPSAIDKNSRTENVFESYDEVFDSWNNVAKELGLPPVKSRTPKRKKTIKKLAPKLWPIIGEVYDEMRQASDWFLREHRPGFDWVWNETNFTKIHEGNYRKKTGSRNRSTYSTSGIPAETGSSSRGDRYGLLGGNTNARDTSGQSMEQRNAPGGNPSPLPGSTHDELRKAS